MTNIQFIITVIAIATATATALFLYRRKKIKDSLIELKCKFCLSENTDELLDTYREQTGVHIDGILGNDFMVENGYVIDYENLIVRHRTVSISIKDSIDILELPLIVLYQGFRKYIFILDTGATASLIHSKHTDNGIVYEDVHECDSEIFGYGGHGESSRTIKTSLYYSKYNVRKD